MVTNSILCRGQLKFIRSKNSILEGFLFILHDQYTITGSFMTRCQHVAVAPISRKEITESRERKEALLMKDCNRRRQTTTRSQGRVEKRVYHMAASLCSSICWLSFTFASSLSKSLLLPAGESAGEPSKVRQLGLFEGFGSTMLLSSWLNFFE